MKNWKIRLHHKLGSVLFCVCWLLAFPVLSGAATPGDVWVFGVQYESESNYSQIPLLRPLTTYEEIWYLNQWGEYNIKLVPKALTNVVAISTGGSNINLILKTDGTVWNWKEGQKTSKGFFETKFTLTQISGLTDIKAISAGERHSLALKNDGTVWAWGYNHYGQLGNGTFTDSSIPVQVLELTGVVAIEANKNLKAVSYAIKADGTVWTWGQSDTDYIFGPWSTPYQNTPVQVAGITDVVDVKTGSYYTIALKTDGTVWWWGTRYYVINQGLYGKVPFEEINTAVPRQMPGLGMPGITNVIAIAQGHDQTHVIRDDHTVWGWGRPEALGTGQPASRIYGQISYNLQPAQISSLSNVVSVASANNYSVAKLADGMVWGWGADSANVIALSGAAGERCYNPYFCTYYNPVLIPQLQDASAISLGTYKGALGQAIFVPSNELPIADNQSVSVDEDSSVTITLSATDGNGDALTYSIASSPLHGSLTGTSANPTYTPATDFNGNDSFTFVVNDGTGDSIPATVSITVTPVNDPPEAKNQSASVDEDFYVALVLTGSDRDGDVLTYSVVASPLHGSLSGTDPNLTYTPTADFNGNDSFTFVSHDGVVDSIPATVFITVMPVNDAPVALANVIYAAPLVPGNSVTLDGSGSTDIDSVIQFYSWTILRPDGTSISIPDQILPQTAFSIDMTGDYLIELLVHDGALNSPVDTISITVISIATASTDLVNDTVAIMAELPVDVFNNKNNQTPLTNKFNVVLEMIAQGSYQIAFDKLNNDIKIKTDGCANSGAPDNNDWIQDCPSQNLLYPQIEEVLSLLQRLL